MVLHYVVGGQYPTGHDFMSNITLWWACLWTLSTAVVLGRALHGCHWRRPSRLGTVSWCRRGRLEHSRRGGSVEPITWLIDGEQSERLKEVSFLNWPNAAATVCPDRVLDG
jgi:hypothetical protein